MNLISFRIGTRTTWGILREDGCVDLRRRLPQFSTLRAAVLANALDVIRQAAASATPDYARNDVTLLRPIDDWRRCFCVGVNYPDRTAEYGDTSGAPQYPSLFMRVPESIVGPDEPLIRPHESRELDYEGEIVLIIGKGGRRIKAADWQDHVFGLTIGNEGTIRDWMRHGKFNVTQGKNFAFTGSLGPFISPLADMPPAPWRIITRVNGEIRQNDTTDRMIFSFGRIVEYISTFCSLEAGDVIFTGTPTGAGARFTPPRFLAPGDVLEIEATGLGTLRNTIADEA